MKTFIAFLLIASLALAAGVDRATLTVSAIVRPKAVVDVQSRTAVRVGITLYPNAAAYVWMAKNACAQPSQPQTIAESGIHDLIFAPEDSDGRDLVCLASTDGALRVSARLPASSTGRSIR